MEKNGVIAQEMKAELGSKPVEGRLFKRWRVDFNLAIQPIKVVVGRIVRLTWIEATKIRLIFLFCQKTSLKKLKSYIYEIIKGTENKKFKQENIRAKQPIQNRF